MTTSPRQTPETPETTLSETLRALSHRYRRRILTALEEAPREGHELNPEVLFTDDDTELVRAVLMHIHLPHLERAGFIEWNRETGTIRRGPEFGDIARLLRLLSDHDEVLPDGWP